MDGFKIGSARIYQLFSNNSEQSSVRKDSAPVTQPVDNYNSDAVKLSASVQQDTAQKQSKVEELKQKVQTGEYQKQISSKQVAKSIIEFYSA